MADALDISQYADEQSRLRKDSKDFWKELADIQHQVTQLVFRYIFEIFYYLAL